MPLNVQTCTFLLRQNGFERNCCSHSHGFLHQRLQSCLKWKWRGASQYHAAVPMIKCSIVSDKNKKTAVMIPRDASPWEQSWVLTSFSFCIWLSTLVLFSRVYTYGRISNANPIQFTQTGHCISACWVIPFDKWPYMVYCMNNDRLGNSWSVLMINACLFNTIIVRPENGWVASAAVAAWPLEWVAHSCMPFKVTLHPSGQVSGLDSAVWMEAALIRKNKKSLRSVVEL